MTATVGNNPYIKLDANGRQIQDSSEDLAFRGDYQGGNNLIYSGFARPGSSTAAAVWQISKHAYDASNNLTSTTWPQNSSSHASSEYQFVWDNRATYTYS
jgi:YD repeat-containing protein